MKISNALHALVAIEKRKDFNRRLNCSIVNVLFFKRSDKEFHAAGPAQEKARLLYVDSRHLGTSRSPRVVERS